jgi:hypothetical protein
MSNAPASQLIITAPQLSQLLLSTRKRRKLTQTARGASSRLEPKPHFTLGTTSR